MIFKGDALDLISRFPSAIDLIVTDPPYAFGGSGEECAISATVAVTLRECAIKLKVGSFMVIFAASSWRSISFMVESVRGIINPIRLGMWNKPNAKTKVRNSGWDWQSVAVIVLRKGDKTRKEIGVTGGPDYILEAPIIHGRRAELPQRVVEWAVAPYAIKGGIFLDPFAGSGALVVAADKFGMQAYGFEKCLERDIAIGGK